MVLVGLFLLPALASAACTTMDRLSVQIPWFSQPQFAGWEVPNSGAPGGPTYAEECLRVQVRPGGPDFDAIEELMSDRADVAMSEGVYIAGAIANGADLTVIGNYFERSALNLATLDTKYQTLQDLEGKRVGVWCCGYDVPIKMMFQKAGVNVNYVSQSFSLNQLHAGEIDAASVMSYNELAMLMEEVDPATNYLRQRTSIKELSPSEYNIPYLHATIIVKTSRLAELEDKIVRLLRVVNRGWTFCRDNELACVKSYPLASPHFQWQMREINKLIFPSTAGLGILPVNRWDELDTFMVGAGLLTSAVGNGMVNNSLMELALAEDPTMDAAFANKAGITDGLEFCAPYGSAAYEACDTSVFEHTMCDLGKYATGPNDLTDCEGCPIGRFSSELGSQVDAAGADQSCSPTCPARMLKCRTCSGGAYQDTTGKSECSFCPRGSYRNSTMGSETCEACPAGKYSAFMGQTACVMCTAGSYTSTTGATVCELCPEGMFSDDMGLSECTACAQGRTTNSRGMFMESDCKCGEGSYQEANSGKCSPCPEGMTCAHGSRYDDMIAWSTDRSLVIPMVNPGYYTDLTDRMSVYLCTNADAAKCPGGGPQTCKGGRVGLVCENCPEGFAWDDSRLVCTECDAGPSVLVIVVLPIVLVSLSIIMFKVANDPIIVNVGNPLMFSVLAGLLITTFQTLALFPGLSIRWQSSQAAVFEGFTFMLGSPEGLPIACAFPGGAPLIFMFRCFLPALCVAAVFVVWIASKVVRKFTGRGDNWNVNMALNTAGQLLQTLFITIAVLVAQPLRCYKHPNGTSSMSLFPEVLCWQGGDHTAIMLLGFAIAICFVIPFIAVCCYAVSKAPDVQEMDVHCARYRFLLYRFRPDVWWWGIVFLFRNMALAFSSCIPADSTHWQITYVAFVTVIYLCCVCAAWPWKNGMLNIMDVVSMMLINGIIVSSSAFVKSADTDSADSFVALHFILMVLFALFVVGLLASIGYWVNQRGIRGAYGRTMMNKKMTVESLSRSWMDFIKASSSLDEETVHSIFTTFNEFDVQSVVKAMGAFQSLDDKLFGSTLSRRLKTLSHSSHSIEGVTSKARAQAEKSNVGRDVVFV